MAHEKFTEMELEQQAYQIMDSFNFEKVWHHMHATGHKWQMDGELRFPTIEELQIQARSLLTKAIYSRDKVTNMGTGGFMVHKLPWGMSMCFQLTWANS